MNTFKGFTLIEVLIALVIISVALTAILKATSQTIRDTRYLENKIVAHWVAINTLNELEASLIPLPTERPFQEDTTQLGISFTFEASLETTPNPNIQKLNVTVFDKKTHHLLTTLSSYHYAEKIA